MQLKYKLLPLKAALKMINQFTFKRRLLGQNNVMYSVSVFAFLAVSVFIYNLRSRSIDCIL